jgi:SAM-dependent methyltransferase
MTGAAAPAPPVPLCPLCGTATRLWFTKSDRRLMRCPDCALVVVPEGVARTSSGASIYEAEDNVFFTDGNEDYYLDETNFENCRLKLAWVERHLDAGSRLLDAGCNFGHFLREASRAYECSGFDLSPVAVDWGRKHLGVESFVASVYELPDALRESFDAVTCWDVIEHLPDALGALERLKAVIRPRGWLFLSTPDAGSLAARVLGQRWHYVDPVQHLALFTRENLRRALARSGFDTVAARSLGHRYRLRYVVSRLRYLHGNGVLGLAAGLGQRVLGPLLKRSVYIQLGDVMLLAARRSP